MCINSFNSIYANIIRNSVCCALFLLLMFEPTHQAAQYAIVICTVAFMYIELNFISTAAHNNTINFLSDRQSLVKWNQKLATLSVKYKSQFNRDIAWAACYPQTKFGLLAIYFTGILMFVVSINDSEVLIGCVLLSIVAGCQFPVYQEFSQIKHQLKTIAHSYRRPQNLITDLIYSFDKIIVRSTAMLLIITGVITTLIMPMEHTAHLFTMAILATIVYLAFAPLLLVYLNGCINLQSVLLFALVLLMEISIFGLVFYTHETNVLYWFVLSVCAFAIAMRIKIQKFVSNQPLEKIINA